MSKRAVIYARVSTDMQRDNFSIPSQIAECRHYAKKRGYTVIGEQFVNSMDGKDTHAGAEGAIPAYVDDFTSRELSRPSLDTSLAYLESYGFDILIVHALDRLARDPYIRQTLEREFNNRGAKIEYVLGNYDETPEGEVRKDLDATFAKWENAKRVERSKRGKRRKAHSGKWVHGMSPYGYRVDREAEDGLAIIKSQAEVVRKIFHWYTEEDFSIKEIKRALVAEGAVQKKGGTTWAPSTINHILDNTIYAGYCHFNKSSRVGSRDVFKDKKEWIRIEVEPIIDVSTFEKALLRKKENRNSRRNQPKYEYFLNRRVVCSECGKTYAAQTQWNPSSRKYPASKKFKSQFYRHRISGGHCMNAQVNCRVLDKIVWDKVQSILLNPAALIEGYEQTVEEHKKTVERRLLQIDVLQRNLLKLEEKRHNLTSVYLDPDIQLSKAEYIKQRDQFDEEEQTINKRVEILREELAVVPEPAQLEVLQHFSDEIVDELLGEQELSLAKKKRILKLMNIKVIYHPDGRVLLDGWLNIPEEHEAIDHGMSVPGSPRVVSTSTSTTTPSRPTTAQE